MNVQEKYTRTVASGGNGVFLKLLSIWQGSVYKLVWGDLALYLIIYYFMSFMYRFALGPTQKELFEGAVHFCEKIRSRIPANFILGFFVSGVIARWWLLWEAIPYVNNVAFIISGVVNGHGRPQLKTTEVNGKVTEELTEPDAYDPQVSRTLRKHIMRYVLLSWILGMMNTSEPIMQRFNFDKLTLSKKARKLLRQRNDSSNQFDDSEPYAVEERKAIDLVFQAINEDKAIKATFGKLITDEEMNVFHEMTESGRFTYSQSCGLEYWIPLQWALRLIQKASLRGYFCDAKILIMLTKKVQLLRREIGGFLQHAALIIPLVYAQVVIIMVYTYILTQLFSSQFIQPLTPEKHSHKSRMSTLDMYVPIFEIIVFIFHMGWLRVAICVLNPFGDDDEDFNLIKILDNQIEVASAAVEADACPTNLERPTFVFLKEKLGWMDNLDDFLTEVELKSHVKFDENVEEEEEEKLNIFRQTWRRCFG